MLTFKDFKSHIDKLKILFEKEETFNDAIQKISFDGYTFIYGEAITQITDLLATIMEDQETQWIEYWIYDLDFGKNWRPYTVSEGGACKSGEIYTKDKPYVPAKGEKDIPLKTVEDLYKLLTKKKGEKND